MLRMTGLVRIEILKTLLFGKSASRFALLVCAGKGQTGSLNLRLPIWH